MTTRQELLEKVLVEHKFATSKEILLSELAKTKHTNPHKLPEHWSDYEKLVHIDLACQIASKKDEVNSLLQDLSKRGIERENKSLN